MKKTILLLVSIIFTISIVSAQNNEEVKPTMKSHIAFKSLVYDFGTVEYGSEAVGEFIFKNISGETIKLTNVKASCGCTGTEWPREEIKKRKKGTIKVTYDTKRVGKFHKTVYVYVDKDENPIQLQVKGNVLPSDNGGSAESDSKKTKLKKTDSPKHVKLNASPKTTKSSATATKDMSTEASVEEEKKTEASEEEKKLKEKTAAQEKTKVEQKAKVK